MEQFPPCIKEYKSIDRFWKKIACISYWIKLGIKKNIVLFQLYFLLYFWYY